jgi:hypothetical protein
LASFVFSILCYDIGLLIIKSIKCIERKEIEIIKIISIENYLKDLNAWDFERRKKLEREILKELKENPWIIEACYFFRNEEIDNIIYAKILPKNSTYYLICKNIVGEEFTFSILLSKTEGMSIFRDSRITQMIHEYGNNVNMAKLTFEKHYKKGREPEYYAVIDIQNLYK